MHDKDQNWKAQKSVLKRILVRKLFSVPRVQRTSLELPIFLMICRLEPAATRSAPIHLRAVAGTPPARIAGSLPRTSRLPDVVVTIASAAELIASAVIPSSTVLRAPRFGFRAIHGGDVRDIRNS